MPAPLPRGPINTWLGTNGHGGVIAIDPKTGNRKWAFKLYDMNMSGMDMTGMRMVSTGFRMVMTSAHRPWSSGDLLLMFAMWAVMMIGMMTPSVAPVVLLYARVRRHASSQGEPFAATGWFAGGYLLA